MENVRAIIMLEILGKPAGYIKKILGDIIKKLGEEKDLKVKESKVAEPKKVEKREDLFTSFAEIEIETSLQKLMAVCFAYMPSHIEIIYPEEIKIRNSDMNMFFNELAKRLHQYDELAKGLLIERETIAKMIKEGKVKVEKKDEEN